MARLLAALSIFATMLATSLAVDLGPVNLHRTTCLSSRFKDCEGCYTDGRLAWCHRLALGKFHRLIAYDEGRTEDQRASRAIIDEACDFLMDREIDMPSITCTGFKSLFVNEEQGLEVGGSATVNGAGATNICAGVFVNQGFSCALATFIIVRDHDGNAISVTIIIILTPTCTPSITVFNLAFETLMASPGFSDIFVNEPVLDFNPGANSTLTIPFVPGVPNP